jgi:hypothetical protein
MGKAARFGAPQITKSMIHCISWMPLALPPPAKPTASACEQAQTPLRAELSHHSIAELVRIEFTGIGKFQNPDRN